MKLYLFGISKNCFEMVKGGFFDDRNIDGLFDNLEEKQGTVYHQITIEKPYFSKEIYILVTTTQKYWMDIIDQLLKLGYRKFSLIYTQNERYEERKLDYSHLDYEKDKKSLVLLYLEHKSYSNIWALEYLRNIGRLNTYDFRVKLWEDNKEQDEYFYDLVTARFIITERQLPYGMGARNAETIQLWHGFPLKVMGNMLVNYNEETDTIFEALWKKFDYIASYGQNYTNFLCACSGTRAKKYIVTGMPRNDLLFVTNGRQNIVDRFPDSKGKKIILYMPTFRETDGVKNGDENGYLFYWNDFDIDELQSVCRRYNLFFVFKLHPSDESKVKEWCVESDCCGLLTDQLLGDKAMYEFLNGADVLLTDYSSVYFDYLLLDRTIIFTNKDESSYADNRGFILEPLEFWRPGPVVNTMKSFYEELIKVVRGEDEFAEARKKLMPFVHHHIDGYSAQRLFDFLKEGQSYE